MNYYRVIDNQDKIDEKYFWYFPNGYTCVDARFVNLFYSRDAAVKSLECFFYKLMYLNDNITYGQLVDEGISLLNRVVSKRGSFVIEKDVYDICHRCYNGDFSGAVANRIYDKRTIMWKSNVDELFVMNESERKEYNSLSEQKKELYLHDFKAKKKQQEAIRYINNYKKMNRREFIINSIEIIKSEKGFCRISDVVKSTGFTFNTVKQHFEEYIKSHMVDGYDLLVNNNDLQREKVFNSLQSAMERMKKKGIDITKNALAKEAGVSRNTVYKHWDNLNK